MREILSILNYYHIGYTILTKSPLVTRDCDLFRLNDNAEIYFTVSPFPEHIRRCIEPYACSLSERITSIQELTRHTIKTHVYVNPVIPYLFDPENIFTAMHGVTPYIDFEGINIRMIDWDLLKTYMAEYIPEAIDRIHTLLSSEDEWNRYWNDLRLHIETINKAYGYTIRTFFHSYLSYFGTLPY